MMLHLVLLSAVPFAWATAYSSVAHKNQHAQAVQACGQAAPLKSAFLGLYDQAVAASCVGGACIATSKCGANFCVKLSGEVSAGGAAAMKGLTNAGRDFLEKISKQTTKSVECPDGSGHQEPAQQTTVTVPTLMDFQRYPTKADKEAKKNSNGNLIVQVTRHESEVACDVINAIFNDAIAITGVGGVFGTITQLCQQL